MGGMKRPLLLALLLGIPLEVVNFRLYAFPIDVGLRPDAGWFTQIMAVRWLILHWLGLRAVVWFHAPYRYLMWCFLAGGYIEVSILLFLILWAIRRLRHRKFDAAS